MTPNDNPLLNQAPSVLNIGIDGFNDSISQHGGRVDHLFWRPPGNADPALAWDLARLMGDPRIAAANQEVTQRIIQSRPMWEDIALRADSVWPEMKGARLLLHAGPPATWARDVRAHAGRDDRRRAVRRLGANRRAGSEHVGEQRNRVCPMP